MGRKKDLKQNSLRRYSKKLDWLNIGINPKCIISLYNKNPLNDLRITSQKLQISF